MTDSRTVTVERDLAHAPEKIWRALTQPHLIKEWLMNSDFEPKVDHRFKFTADWGSVDCQVLVVEPGKILSYRWDAIGLESIVPWTLTKAGGGTRLRMEQSGFKADQEQAYQGAQYGWKNFFGSLERVLAEMEA